MGDPWEAATPPLGFNTWNRFGMSIDEDLIEGTIEAMVAQGLRDLGYGYLNIDDGWMAPERDRLGRLAPDPDRFPRGIRRLADLAHRAGLRLGIYSDCGERTCGGLPASFGHEREDAESFAAWGCDFLKYDWCHVPFERFPGQSPAEVAKALYGRMAEAVRAAGRPMLLSLCSWGIGEPWLWARGQWQMWRTTDDIVDAYRREGTGWTGDLLQVFHRNARLDEYAGPGGWNDPDMLEVGNGGMSDREQRSHFALWCLMAAPLLIGTDVRRMSDATRAILGNRELLAVDQDPLGRQARLLRSEEGLHLLVKPLAGGDLAVGVFNERDDEGECRLDWDRLGAGARRLVARDLWTGRERRVGGLEGSGVAPHATEVWRLMSLD